MFKRKQPKYELGDRVRFVNSLAIGPDSVKMGKIWKIRTYWLCKPIYEVFEDFDPYSGYNYHVSESEVVEVLAKGNGMASNPYKPTKQ